jgi:hypothetical protein
MEKKDFAGMLYIHPLHLSNTIKEITGQITCNLYENRLLDVSKEVSKKGDYGQHRCTQPYINDFNSAAISNNPQMKGFFKFVIAIGPYG